MFPATAVEAEPRAESSILGLRDDRHIISGVVRGGEEYIYSTRPEDGLEENECEV